LPAASCLDLTSQLIQLPHHRRDTDVLRIRLVFQRRDVVTRRIRPDPLLLTYIPVRALALSRLFELGSPLLLVRLEWGSVVRGDTAQASTAVAMRGVGLVVLHLGIDELHGLRGILSVRWVLWACAAPVFGLAVVVRDAWNVIQLAYSWVRHALVVDLVS
jgi:hypothetical protein